MSSDLSRSTPSTTPPTPSSSSTPVPTSSSRVLHFTGHSRFRHRLILSLLSRRPVRIDRIRPDDDNPGLKVYEVSFLRLVEKLTQGSKVEISYTGTSVLFHPGTIQHGQVTHQCPLERGVGWFLEPLLAIAPFGKKDLSLTLRGVTTDGRDASVDVVRTSGLPHLAMFLDKEGVELRITKRGHPPLGGGEVTLTCPSVRSIKSGFEFTSLGRISKIRGIAHSVRVSPQLANRLVASARSVLNRYIPDIYIYTDVYRGEDSGNSSSPQTPEDLGLIAARQLLTEIARGGCVDRGWEWLVTTMLVLGGEDVGKVRVAGPLEAGLIAHLRDLKAFFGTTFKIKPVASLPSTAADAADEGGGGGKERDEYVLSCVGTGFVNTARRAG
ncbi:hypothetical protein JCM10295v2_007198 [Rhodotorula toruloides]